jgi:nitrogen fixation NifU-like protein
MQTASAMYQELILDHNRSPRNYGRLPNANHRAVGNNPLCGDRLAVWLVMEGDRVREAAFEASGCAISVASASLMTEAIKGRTKAEAELLFDQFRRLVTDELDPGDAAALGKLGVFSGVRESPLRVKCATLSWHAMKAALRAPEAQVTTE